MNKRAIDVDLYHLRPFVSALCIYKRLPRATPVTAHGKHFSFDNMLGIYSYYKLNGRFDGMKRNLPSLWWISDGQLYIRSESIFLMYAKYNWIKYAFFWFLYPYFMIAMILSALRAPEHMGGCQKWFLRASLFLPSVYMKVLKKVLKWQGLNLYNVFCDYYSTYNPYPEEHPTVEEAQLLLLKGEF